MSTAGAACALGRVFATACLLAFPAACDPAQDGRAGEGAAQAERDVTTAGPGADGTPRGSGPAGRTSDAALAGARTTVPAGTPRGSGPAGRTSDAALLGARTTGPAGPPRRTGPEGAISDAAQRTEQAAAVVPEVRDDRGRRLARGTPRRRIVSLLPAATETLVAIGAADRLVARTDYDVQPALAHLPSVGGGLDPSLEFLVQLAPDLVVAWPSADGARTTEARMDDFGVDTYGAAPQTVADFRRLAANLGRLLGLERAADSLIAAVGAQLAEARAAWAGKTPVTAMYVVSRSPALTTGGGTFLDSVMAAAGAVNVFADAGGGWPRISLEEVVSRDPRYLLVPVSGAAAAQAARGGAAPGAWLDEESAVAARLAEEAGWAEAPAVAAGRVVAVDADLFGRPGPRMGEAALRLARLLHGAPAR